MQETAKIAIDYAQLLKKKTPKGKLTILGLNSKKTKKASSKSVVDENSDKNKKTSPKVNDHKQDKALIKEKVDFILIALVNHTHYMVCVLSPSP